MYEVTVVVTDTKGNSDEQDVTVKVTNVEEDGVIELSTLHPRVGFPVTATLTDPDNITAGSVSWQWYQGSITIDTSANNNNNGLPERECAEAGVNNCFIMDATSATYMVVADDSGKMLTAVASYTDGSPNEGDAKDVIGRPSMNQVLADTRNKAPVFPEQGAEQERSVLENTPPNMPIGTTNAGGVVTADPVIAMDFITENTGPPTAEVLTYSLGGPDAASFSINRGLAVLSTKAALDKETKDTYVITVRATDPSGLTATVTVTIKVTDEDEAPIIMLGGLAISGIARVDYAEDGTEAVATYTASGPDAGMAAWTLGGDDANAFSLIDNREFMFMQPPDYENPMDADMDNVYMVTIMADDGTYMDSHNVRVMVTNEDEMGRVTFWRDGQDATTAAIMVGDELGGAVDDSDGNPGDTFPIAMYTRIAGVNVTSWQWAKSMTPDMMDSWMDIGTGGMYTVMNDDAGHYLRATAMYDDGEGMGKMASEETMMVGADDAGGTLFDPIAQYDADDSGAIEKDEVIQAIKDYLFGEGAEAISKDDAIETIKLYLFS